MRKTIVGILVLSIAVACGSAVLVEEAFSQSVLCPNQGDWVKVSYQVQSEKGDQTKSVTGRVIVVSEVGISVRSSFNLPQYDIQWVDIESIAVRTGGRARSSYILAGIAGGVAASAFLGVFAALSDDENAMFSPFGVAVLSSVVFVPIGLAMGTIGAVAAPGETFEPCSPHVAGIGYIHSESVGSGVAVSVRF